MCFAMAVVIANIAMLGLLILTEVCPAAIERHLSFEGVVWNVLKE
jgi:hypothetical protein